MHFSFRQAQNSDSQEIQKVIFTTLLEYYLTPEPEGADKDIFNLDQYYFNNRGYFEVCLVDHHIVGTWGLYQVGNDSCELRKMYLLKEYRGHKIGEQMLTRAILKARELGYKKIELETASQLKEAISLYEKFGFKKVSKNNLVARCDQTYELILPSIT